MSIKFPKLIKEILKPLPKNDYPVLNTFLFVSCWIGFALDKSLVSMRDLCTRMNLQGINVQLSTFSKASKIREIEVFEKIIADLNKRLSIKKFLRIKKLLKKLLLKILNKKINVILKKNLQLINKNFI